MITVVGSSDLTTATNRIVLVRTSFTARWGTLQVRTTYPLASPLVQWTLQTLLTLSQVDGCLLNHPLLQQFPYFLSFSATVQMESITLTRLHIPLKKSEKLFSHHKSYTIFRQK